MNALDLGLGAIEQDFWGVVFLMLRTGAGLLAAPFFGAAAIPVTVRISLTGALAIFIGVWMPQISPPEVLFSTAGLLAVAGEIAIGLALGFVLQIAFAAPTIAAEVIGAQQCIW